MKFRTSLLSSPALRSARVPLVTLAAVGALAAGAFASGPAASASTAPLPASRVAAAPEVRSPFTIATFNMLGASHTDGHGNKRGWARSTTRTGWAVNVFRGRHLDVMGLQEFEPRQHAAFRRTGGGTYGMYAVRHNAVAWRKSAFAFVSASSVTVPYFHGTPIAMPVVKLRSRVSGQTMTFISVHNPADVRGPAQRWRNRAVHRELARVRALRSQGNPVFLLGDMNDRSAFFCRATRTGVLHAAAGGSRRHGHCRMPSFSGVDWIMGTPGVHFSHFEVARNGVLHRLSDHGLVSAHVS